MFENKYARRENKHKCYEEFVLNTVPFKTHVEINTRQTRILLQTSQSQHRVRLPNLFRRITVISII